jgi:polyisoprenyl-teichoic acid--peptidoglycan teichoic acid transferase
LNDRDSDKPAAGDPVPEAQDGRPQAPTPTTWAGRARQSQDGDPAPDQEHGEGPASLPDDTDPDQLEEELDAEELDEEALAEELGEGNGPGPSHDTVEADTPTLADREAAREAALAGLRARTAEHAAKQTTGASGTAAPPAPEAPAALPEAPPAPEPQPPGEETPPPAEEETAPPAAEGTPPPAEETPPPAEEPVEPDEPERPPQRALWPRFVAGSLLIIVAMATATAVSILVYLADIARGLGGLRSVQSGIVVADPGKPQTILILGSDKRPGGQEIGARSDTTILLRVAADQITVLSIPRDLKVNIPGHGIDKFNAAYSYGGPKLTLKVVKQLTGIDDINHVVNVNFTGFADAVNAIDCVYVDVDHHYFHSNVGLGASEQYAEIDIPAGYQRMCGYNALQYVRYRHDDNDLVRSARQQDFLREARQELPASKILADRNQLIDILKKYVTSDIANETDLVGLGKLFIGAHNAPVVQVHFPANLGGPTASYVTASQQAIRDAVQKFEGETPTAPTPPQGAGASGSKSKKKKKGGGSKKSAKPTPPPPLIDSELGQQYAAQLAGAQTKGGKPMINFPIYYPTKLAVDSTLTDDSRAFPIDGPGNETYRGYKLVAELPTDGYTAYYGVSGTDWRDPPILANPTEVKTIGGRDYLLSWDGDQLRFIGWKTDHGSFWVDNTLLNALTPGQMFGIAESMRHYKG